MPLLTAVLGLGLPGVFSLVLARTLTPAGPTATQKMLAVAALFAGWMLSFAVTASVGIQREAPDPAPIGAYLGIAVVAGAALVAGAWFLLPRAIPGRAEAATPAPAVVLEPGERVAWVGYARFRTGVLGALIATVILVAGAMVFVIAVTGLWIFAAIPLLLLGLLLGTTVWSVRVDARGLEVRAALGWPRVRVPIDDVESAGTIDLVPLGEFGGYGLRLGLGGRLGVVTRGGEALEVQRRDGRAVVVTVDDAATAAGLLTAYAAKPA
jgi:hypothetical protein